jgi:hypothetical protein
MAAYAGYTETLEWVPTAEVQADKTLDLTRHGLGVIVHRVFTVTGAPWWAGEDMRTAELAGQALIVKRSTGAGQPAHVLSDLV